MLPQIGETAGQVWYALGKNGKTPASKLGKMLNLSPEHVHLAIGWLARENKIHLSFDGKTANAELTDSEKKAYAHHCKK